MRVALEHRPAVIVVLMNSQYQPLRFTLARLRLLQDVAKKMPELPLLVSLHGNLKHVEIQSLDIWNENLVKALNL